MRNKYINVRFRRANRSLETSFIRSDRPWDSADCIIQCSQDGETGCQAESTTENTVVNYFPSIMLTAETYSPNTRGRSVCHCDQPSQERHLERIKRPSSRPGCWIQRQLLSDFLSKRTHNNDLRYFLHSATSHRIWGCCGQSSVTSWKEQYSFLYI